MNDYENYRSKILIVDDNSGNLDVLEMYLKSLDVIIIRAENGKEAIEKSRKNDLALALLDIQMPEMNGYELAKALLKGQSSKHLPIIFLTAAFHNVEDALMGYEAGGVDYIIKPFNKKVLVGKVKTFIQLDRQQKEIERQRDVLIELDGLKKEEINELRATTNHLLESMGWESSSVTASMSGVGPLGKRETVKYQKILEKYESLLDLYLEALGFNTAPPRREINELSREIGDLAGGAQDVIEIHMKAVLEKSSNVSIKRARAYTLEGRLLAIEVMGNLVDYYRMSRVTVAIKGT